MALPSAPNLAKFETRDPWPLGMGSVLCPQGDWGGAGTGQPDRVAGDHTVHKVCCVAASALWENEHHEVFLFWTIWYPRDPKPKKTWTEEPEQAMLKPAGETGPPGVAQGSARRFSTGMRVLMTGTDSLPEAPSGPVTGLSLELRELLHRQMEATGSSEIRCTFPGLHCSTWGTRPEMKQDRGPPGLRWSTKQSTKQGKTAQ